MDKCTTVCTTWIFWKSCLVGNILRWTSFTTWTWILTLNFFYDLNLDLWSSGSSLLFYSQIEFGKGLISFCINKDRLVQGPRVQRLTFPTDSKGSTVLKFLTKSDCLTLEKEVNIWNILDVCVSRIYYDLTHSMKNKRHPGGFSSFNLFIITDKARGKDNIQIRVLWETRSSNWRI